ncbi:POH2 hydrophobin [Mycena vitilis]|nr:POH2 hydrophobin [Mycena vitilis]
MFFKLSVLATSVLVGLVAARPGGGYGGGSGSGGSSSGGSGSGGSGSGGSGGAGGGTGTGTGTSPQCCNSVQSSNSGSAVLGAITGLLGINLSGLDVPIGLSCSPITVLGNNCGGTTVNCDTPNESWNGLIAINCLPITL